MEKWWMDWKKIDTDKIMRMDKEKEERRVAFIAKETKEAKERARKMAKKWDKFRFKPLKVAILFTIMALATTQVFAWGIYHGKRARVFYNNPWPTSGPFIAGTRYGYPQYNRALRGHLGGYRAYGGGGNMGWYWQQRQVWALEDIADGVKWGDLK